MTFERTAFAQTVLDPGVFAARRRTVMDAYGPGSVLVVAAAGHALRNGDVDHEWRQSSDFWYLTGFDEPETLLVLVPGRADGEAVAFVRPRDPAQEVWHGRRVGVEGAIARLGVDQAFDLKDFDEQLANLVEGAKQLCWHVGRDPALDQRLIRVTRRHRATPRLHLDGPDFFADLAAVMGELRLIKGPAEIEALRRAAKLTAEAHNEAMRVCQSGMNERQLQAVVEFVFRAGGAARVGYGSIVARGDNATILHYVENDQMIGPSDLVLIDAGGEVAYQTADITRTFPASGRFSPEQRAVYEVVLQAEHAAIALCTPEHRFVEVHERAVQVLTEGLVKIGLLRGDVEQLIQDEKYKRFYMHRTSHWLGMDVHDAGRYHDSLPTGNLSRQLVPGMVLTVEPGLYIAADDTEVPERFRGIGVRIEDDILITAGAPEVLTADCIKEIDDIERIVGTGGRWVAAVDPAFGDPF